MGIFLSAMKWLDDYYQFPKPDNLAAAAPWLFADDAYKIIISLRENPRWIKLGVYIDAIKTQKTIFNLFQITPNPANPNPVLVGETFGFVVILYKVHP